MAATESSTRAMAALDDLYRRHVGDVYRYTYAVLGNHADAEDVTQTTFVNALRALERGETPRNASHWLLAISHNLVRQRWRQAASRPTVVELVHDVPDEATEEENVELDSLVRALQRIPPSQREALVMRELEGRPYSEIAELLGITTSALETLLFRARRSLAEELENVVTCQNAELAISQRLDGRLSRKDRKRLEEHLADCPSCAQLAKTQERQRRAFKGLAVLPIPLGLALFKGVPAASAAVVPIGAAASAGGVGATGVGAGGAVAAGSAAGAGGAVAGGTLLGGAAVKVAAVVVAATVATGVGYQGVKAVQDKPSKPAPTSTKATKEGIVGSGATEVRARPIVTRAVTTNGAERRATPTPPVKAQGTDGAPGQLKKVAGVSAGYGNSAAAKERAAEKKAERAVTPRGKDAAKDKPIATAPKVKPKPKPSAACGQRAEAGAQAESRPGSGPPGRVERQEPERDASRRFVAANHRTYRSVVGILGRRQRAGLVRRPGFGRRTRVVAYRTTFRRAAERRLVDLPTARVVRTGNHDDRSRRGAGRERLEARLPGSRERPGQRVGLRDRQRPEQGPGQGLAAASPVCAGSAITGAPTSPGRVPPTPQGGSDTRPSESIKVRDASRRAGPGVRPCPRVPRGRCGRAIGQRDADPRTPRSKSSSSAR